VNPGATSESASLAASEGGDESPIMFHRVPEPKTVKNRLHLDLISADFDADLARLALAFAHPQRSFLRKIRNGRQWLWPTAPSPSSG
jgi:hypothetical protein